LFAARLRGSDAAENLIEAVCLLLCQGRTDRECMNILQLSYSDFQQVKLSIKSINTTPQTAQQAFESFAWEQEKFKIRIQHQLTQLDELLTDAMRPDPLEDRAYDIRASNRIIISQSRLAERLARAEASLLGIKIALGLVTPAQPQLPAPLNGNGNGPLFTSATLKEVWKQRQQRELEKLN
jgi:hypothetical protein